MFYLNRWLALGATGGFWLGIIGGTYIETSWSFLGLLFLIAGVIVIISFKQITEHRLIYLIISCSLIGLLLGCGRIWLEMDQLNKQTLPLNQKVNLTGIVATWPDQRENSLKLIARIEETKTKVLVSADPYLKVGLGDRIEIVGKVTKPENFLNEETKKEFDYVNYLKAKNISYQINWAEVTVIKPKAKYYFWSNLLDLKQTLLTSLKKQLPGLPAGLIAGLLWGERQGLSDFYQTQFRRVGLTHIIVLSGYNVAIVIVAVTGLCLILFKQRLIVYLLASFSILIFVLLVGFGTTVVRASVMAFLALSAKLFGQNYRAGIGLIVAGTIMIIWQPFILQFDPGFQLSFLATLGLIYLTPILEQLKIIKFWPWGLKSILSTTLGAQIMVLPWLIYKLGEISIVALPTNLLVLPIIPWLMFGGFITSVLGLISDWLALLTAVPTYYLTSLVFWLVSIMSNWEQALIVVTNVNLIIVLGLYFLIGLFIYFKHQSVLSTT